MAEPVRARRLTDQEGQRLQQIVRRGKHGSVRVRRAMIIMASASGTLVPAIARLVAADEDTVRDMIHLFNQKGLAALDPQWAGGRPRLISDGDVEVQAGQGVLRIDVRDDGRGGATFAHGSGLVGLRDRVEALGGKLSLRSPPGAGTTISIAVCLDDGGEAGPPPAGARRPQDA